MTKEEIFAIIDDELEKRKLNTFLLWDFPNDVKKRIEKLYQSVDNANPSEALDYMKSLFECWKNLAEKDNKDNLETKEIELEKYNFKENYDTIKQALLKLDRYEKILGSGRLTDRNYKNTTLPLESCKPYLRLGQLEDIYEEAKKNE